jgi:hypothetical protein
MVRYLKIKDGSLFKSGFAKKAGFMKRVIALELFIVTTLFAGCGIVEGIFKAGVWIGIMASAVVIGLIIYIMMRLRRK